MIKSVIKAFENDSLFRNSLYLMTSTGALAGFGFLFWLISAHLFSPGQIGLATTLIAVMNLISFFSLLGFNQTFVRFLPRTSRPSEHINTGLLIVCSMAVVLATLFVSLSPHFAPELGFVRAHWWSASLFVFFAASAALNLITDSVFLAYRSAKFTLMVNVGSGFVRVTLPFLLINSGALGIFWSSGLASLIALGLSLAVMIKYLHYRPTAGIDASVLRQVAHYNSANYLAGIFNLLPVTTLPLIINARLDSPRAAYYYIAMQIANLLYAIPYAITQSLFAEGSHEHERLEHFMRRALKLIALIMLPALLGLLLTSHLILTVFGASYASSGAPFLRLLVLASLLVAANTLMGVIFKVRRQVGVIILTNLTYCVGIIGFSWYFLTHGLGLDGVGYGWLAGQAAMTIVSLLFLARKTVIHRQKPAATARDLSGRAVESPLAVD